MDFGLSLLRKHWSEIRCASYWSINLSSQRSYHVVIVQTVKGKPAGIWCFPSCRHHRLTAGENRGWVRMRMKVLKHPEISADRQGLHPLPLIPLLSEWVGGLWLGVASPDVLQIIMTSSADRKSIHIHRESSRIRLDVSFFAGAVTSSGRLRNHLGLDFLSAGREQWTRGRKHRKKKRMEVNASPLNCGLCAKFTGEIVQLFHSPTPRGLSTRDSGHTHVNTAVIATTLWNNMETVSLQMREERFYIINEIKNKIWHSCDEKYSIVRL